MMKECKRHGFYVEREGNTLYLLDTDGRYHTKKFSLKHWKEGIITSQNEEMKLLKELGFKLSTERRCLYWTGR